MMPRPRNLLRLARRFGQINHRRRMLLIEAAARLTISRVELMTRDFTQIAPRFGEFVAPTDPRATPGRKYGSGETERVVEDIGWAVRSAARHLPFKVVCLPQAMAAHAILKRHGIASVMHFGAARAPIAPLDTHAWLDAAGIEVTGYDTGKAFVEIGCFV